MTETMMLFIISLISIGITTNAGVQEYFQCTKPPNEVTRNRPRDFVASTKDGHTMITTTSSRESTTSKMQSNPSSVEDETAKTEFNTEDTTASTSDPSSSGIWLSTTYNVKETTESSTDGLTIASSSNPSTSKIQSTSSSVGDRTTENDINNEVTTALSSDPSTSGLGFSSSLQSDSTQGDINTEVTTFLSSELSTSRKRLSTTFDENKSTESTTAGLTIALSSTPSTLEQWSSTTFVETESTVSSTLGDASTFFNKMSTTEGVTSRAPVIDVNTPANCPDLTLLPASYDYSSEGNPYTSTYYMSTISKTKDESADACTCLQDALLVFMETIEEKDLVVEAFKVAENSGAHFWTGLEYREGSWRWYNAFGDIEYLEWAGNGVNGGKACSVMHKNAGLQTKKCDDQFLFICEVQKQT